MAALDDLLDEEYRRLIRMKVALEREFGELPKGYIARKTIRGKTYNYLQWREGGSVKSKFISEDDIADMLKKINRRKQLAGSLKDINATIKKLEKVK